MKTSLVIRMLIPLILLASCSQTVHNSLPSRSPSSIKQHIEIPSEIYAVVDGMLAQVSKLVQHDVEGVRKDDYKLLTTYFEDEGDELLIKKCFEPFENDPQYKLDYSKIDDFELAKAQIQLKEALRARYLGQLRSLRASYLNDKLNSKVAILYARFNENFDSLKTMLKTHQLNYRVMSDGSVFKTNVSEIYELTVSLIPDLEEKGESVIVKYFVTKMKNGKRAYISDIAVDGISFGRVFKKEIEGMIRHGYDLDKKLNKIDVITWFNKSKLFKKNRKKWGLNSSEWHALAREEEANILARL